MSAAVIFWLCVALAVVCGFMAMRMYFIGVGRREAMDEAKVPNQSAFLNVGHGVVISNPQITDNTYQVGGTVRPPPSPPPVNDIKLEVSIHDPAFGRTTSPLETLVLFHFVFDCNLAVALKLGDFSLEVVAVDGGRPITDRLLPVAHYIVPEGWENHEHWNDSEPTNRKLTIKDDLFFTTYPIRPPDAPMPQFGLTTGMLCFVVDAPFDEVTRTGTKFYIRCKDGDKITRLWGRYTLRNTTELTMTGLVPRPDRA